MSFLKKRSFLVCVGMGEGCAVVLTALLLLPCAWAIHCELLPQQAGWLCAAGCAMVSVLIPAAVIARVRRREALATGGAIALGYVTLAALMCALGGKGYDFGVWLGALAAAVAAGGLLGAVLSVRQNTHKRRRR